MKVVVIDGQGGRMGKSMVEQLRAAKLEAEIWAVGTNSIATAAMVKAGADYGSTGENPVLVAAREADVIVGPIGIVIADALFGEVTPAMAAAVGRSRAEKVLLPVNKCNNHVVTTVPASTGEVLSSAVEYILRYCREN